MNTGEKMDKQNGEMNGVANDTHWSTFTNMTT